MDFVTMFRKTEAIMTPQEAEELGVSVASAKQAISRNAPTTEGGTNGKKRKEARSNRRWCRCGRSRIGQFWPAGIWLFSVGAFDEL